MKIFSVLLFVLFECSAFTQNTIYPNYLLKVVPVDVVCSQNLCEKFQELIKKSISLGDVKKAYDLLDRMTLIVAGVNNVCIIELKQLIDDLVHPKDMKLTLSPNPCSSNQIVKCISNALPFNGKVDLFSISGEFIYSTCCRENVFVIDKELAEGFYLIRLFNPENSLMGEARLYVKPQ